MEDLVPRLEGIVEGREEHEELDDDLWEEIARSPLSLLDARDPDGGLGIARLTVAVEALATARQTFLMPVLLTALPSVVLLLDGDEEQQRRFLEPVRQGVQRAVFALSEEAAGSDVSAITTTARRAEGGFVLSGRKAWVSVPGRADWVTVFARSADADGLSCFVVPADAPGVSWHGPPALLGMGSIPLCDLVLDDVVVDERQLVGQDGRGFGIAMRTLNAVRPIVAARGLGLTAQVLMAATEYVEQRSAYGGRLADLQLVRGELGGLAARLEACRLLTYHAAALVDRDGPGKEHAAVLAAAKLLGTELAVDAATACLHLAGAAGYTTALVFERALREAQQLTIVEGASEVQMELVARGLLDRSLWWDASRAAP